MKREYEVEYREHTLKFLERDVFPTLDSFMDAIKTASIREISSKEDKKIYDRSRTRSISDLLHCIMTYRSYPKYRNLDKLNGIVERMKSGGDIVDSLSLN